MVPCTCNTGSSVADTTCLKSNCGFHFFTDGSCLNQAYPTCRLAAWSVVCADSHGSFACQVVDSGPLPGLLQSSYRAEIYAVWRALCVARMQHGKIHVWSDCGVVVKRLDRLLAGHEPKPNSAHSDLWRSIFQCLEDFGRDQVVIHKVAAHQRVSHACTPVGEWSFAHNSFADRAALYAQWSRPASFFGVCLVSM